ncbi:molybdopterin molybdochelatase [Spirosomataceae bacterium TFI 002]|nr:molybdopterin molybdochelatase [Spirosomataceae bacterium TFI 002]
MKPKEFISVAKAEEIVLSKASSFGIEKVELLASQNRMLAESIYADRDFPPFDRVTMDGIAIDSKAYKSGQRTFLVEGVQYAGDCLKSLQNPQHCFEVMTGAVLPLGTDSIIRYEEVEIANGNATLGENIKLNVNIHRQGSDAQSGDLLLSKGKKIQAGDLAVMATVGMSSVAVQKLPKIAIITSGDELVPIAETPLPHQIRTSNVYAIHGLIQDFASEVTHFHLPDSLSISIEKLGKLSQEYDVVVISGGVSKGKKDHIPAALASIGIEQHFHKVQQRPGKPFWFGSNENTIVFALPGNPVSSFMCAVRYLIPFLKKSTGQNAISQNFALLHKDINFKPQLTYFAQVQIFNENGVIIADPLEGGGSGDLANLSKSNAFLELPHSHKNLYAKGEVFRFWAF